MKTIRIVFKDDTPDEIFFQLAKLIESDISLFSDQITATLFVEPDEETPDASDQREVD